MKPIYIDLTSLIGHPFRTGIQRVEREIIERWPGPRPLQPVMFDESVGEMRLLSPKIFDLLLCPSMSFDEARMVLHEAASTENFVLGRSDIDILLNPELLWEKGRAQYYRDFCAEGGRAVWVVHDFFPVLRPENYQSGSAKGCMYYYRSIRSISAPIFMSKRTQMEYEKRIMRGNAASGITIPLGGDTFGSPVQRFSRSRKAFLVVGTIERRKRVDEIIEAFQVHWARGGCGELMLVGRLDEFALKEQDLIASLKDEARFTYAGALPDKAIADLFKIARATIYNSREEGFGIPPYESLHLGVPVILRKGIPSVEMLSDGGRIELRPEDGVSQLASAVDRLMDDVEAENIWTEAGALHIPTWSEYVSQVSEHVHKIVTQPNIMKDPRKLSNSTRVIDARAHFASSERGLT